MSDRSNGKGAETARGLTLVVTNLTKLAGVVAAMNELLVRDTTTTARAALIALLVAGVQAFETMVLGVIDRVIGKPEKS